MQISNSSSWQINISNSQPAGGAEKPPKGGAQPPSHEEAVSQLGASLSEEQQGIILSGVEAMQEEGASDAEIKAYVDSSLEEYGVDLSQVRGALTDTIA